MHGLPAASYQPTPHSGAHYPVPDSVPMNCRQQTSLRGLGLNRVGMWASPHDNRRVSRVRVMASRSATRRVVNEPGTAAIGDDGEETDRRRNRLGGSDSWVKTQNRKGGSASPRGIEWHARNAWAHGARPTGAAPASTSPPPRYAPSAQPSRSPDPSRSCSLRSNVIPGGRGRSR